jgi:tetratricopeptide (TPR) repeat protein
VAVADPENRIDHPAALFGRGEMHETILQSLAKASRGGGELLLLEGKAGVGKSTLLRRTVEDARSQGFVALFGRALPSDLPEPFSLLRDLLRSLREAPSRRPALAEPTILSIFLAPAAVNSAPASDGREVDEAEKLLLALPGGEDAGEGRTALFERIADFFLDLADRTPLLLAIDDLNLVDSSTLAFLETFSRMIDLRRILVVATIPATDPSARKPSQLDELLRGERVHRVNVRNMTESEVADYARYLLGKDPGRENVLRWYTKTEGNPLFVEYLVRGTMVLGKSPPDVAGASATDLYDILRARSRALSEADQRVLTYATVLGREFDFPTLTVAAGAEEETLAEALDRLVRSGLLREKGGEVYEFVSERIRSESYDELTETKRRILHRRVGKALEGRVGTGTAVIFALAQQYYLAQENKKAVKYNREAAAIARRTFSYESEIVYLERSLECVHRDPTARAETELAIRIELGRALDDHDEFPRAESVLEEAVARARGQEKLSTQLGLALLNLARVRVNRGAFPSAIELANEGRMVLGPNELRQVEIVIHQILGNAYRHLGEFEAAEIEQRAEIAAAERSGNQVELGHGIVDLANILLSRPGRQEETIELFDRASRIFAEVGDDSMVSWVHLLHAIYLKMAEDLSGGLAMIEKAREFADRSRSRRRIAYTEINMAQFLVEMERPEDARRAWARGRDALEPLGDRYASEQLHMTEGLILEAEGQLDRAEAMFLESEQESKDLALSSEVVECVFRRAHLEHSRGNFGRARELLQQAKTDGIETLKIDIVDEVRRLEKLLARASEAPAPPSRRSASA